MNNCPHLRHRWQKAIKAATSVCASGDSNDEAAEELANQYEVPEGTVATIYGYKTPIEISIFVSI